MRLISLLGIFTFVFLGWLVSVDRRKFPWRTFFMGITVQFLLAFLILKTSFGRSLFEATNSFFVSLLGYSRAGAQFLFGPLAENRPEWGFLFFASVLPSIIFMSALMSFLYHIGFMQLVVVIFARVLVRILGTSGPEALAAASNIFVGQTEAPLFIRPYLKDLRISEIMVVMTSGMATVAGGVLVAYVGMGISGAHLLVASVLSAPASIIMARVIMPSEILNETQSDDRRLWIKSPYLNALDAITHGARDGLLLAANVGAMLVAFISLIALANGLLKAATLPILGVAITWEEIFGYLKVPFAFLLGVSWEDCSKVGALLGYKLVLNEFVAYRHLADLKNVISERSFTLATYALCGFANFGSIAIQIGGLSALEPNLRPQLTRLGLRALLAGTLACYVTAAVMGVILD